MAGEEEGEQPLPEKDRIIDNRTFKMGGGISLDAFISTDGLADAKRPALPGASPTDATAGEAPEVEVNEIEDVAIGDVFDPFEKDAGPRPGDILRDGTVYMTPEMDTVTEIAVEGERRLHWALMVAMIIVYSLIGWLVATALPPMAATAGLIGLATLGFILGERWVPDQGMHLLGVTWVIISMKLLYGLALDAHHWNWIDTPQLGLALIGLVGVNIAVGYRHGHDAIMAQATLVSLAIASAAGSVGGELGVAVLILIATLLLHGLALHRRSGNLASLGIAASHMWIGLHAIQSSPLEIGALKILPLVDPMPLFLLALSVACINGAMAAQFARSENWFSKGISVTGLGKPGLWGVSVGLGMIGAMLLLASGRDETGYALGILMTLLGVYGGSYLVVRGVEPMEVLKPLLGALPFLVVILVGFETLISAPLSGYEIFAALAAVVTIGILLRHQSNVTDRVLWIGSLVLILLLTIMIPAEALESGGDGGLLLLSALILVHFSTAWLALRRDSPSIAGVTVLAPWAWMFAHRFWTSSIENLSQARNFDVSGWDLVVLDPAFIAVYLGLAAMLQYPVNMRLGDTGVNLAGKLIGASELSARLRDSGLMKLWNLGLISGLAVWLMILEPRNDIGWIAVASILPLVAVHVAAEAQGRHQGNPRLILICLAIAFAVFQWNGGLDAVWMILLTAASVTILLTRGESGPSSQMLSLTMGLLTVQICLFGLDRHLPFPLIDPEPLTRMDTGWIMLLMSMALLAIYLPLASQLEKLLPPAVAVVLLLSLQIWATSHQEMAQAEVVVAMGLFVATAIYLSAQGELRMELKQVGKREARLSRIHQRQLLAEALASGDLSNLPPADVKAGHIYHFPDEEIAARAAADPSGALIKAVSQSVSTGELEMADPEMIALIDKQRKRRRKAGPQGDEQLDLLIGDIHHRPVIVMAFIAVTTFAACWMAWMNASLNPGLLLLVSLFALTLSYVSRQRAKVHHLRLPDVMGIEMPFALTMGGLGLIYLIGHFGPGGSKFAQLDLMVLCFALIGIAILSLFGRDDLAWRVPSAAEWVVLTLVMVRVMGSLFVNATPFPFTVDPLDSSIDMMEWTLPWLFHEGVLLFLVCVWEWIEGFRRKREMPDHRGAAGRGGFALMVMLISTGPAGLIAGLLCLRRSFDWKQPAGAAMSVHVLLGSGLAFLAWTRSPDAGEFLAAIVLGVGVTMVVAHLITIILKMPKWTTAWLWNAHILLPVGVLFVAGWSGWIVVALISLSLVTWVGGILQLRRGMRIVGAFDLALTLAVWLLIVKDGVLEPTMLLLMLTALGTELGIVAWLGTRYDLQLAKD
jgi:hypothetical protein